jgi:hypothetical protein
MFHFSLDIPLQLAYSLIVMQWILIYGVGLTLTQTGNIDLATQYNGTGSTIYATSGSTTRTHKQEVTGATRTDIPWATWLKPLKATTFEPTLFIWPQDGNFPIASGETYYRYYRTTRGTGFEWWEDELGIEGGDRSRDWTEVTLNTQCADYTDCRPTNP